MIITKFYNLINSELLEILQNNTSDERMEQHKDIAQNKGYAFMIWFLRFYGQKDFYKSYITDGKDDSSCDIIFSNKDIQGKDIFYVVQSKVINLTVNENNELIKSKDIIINEDTFPKINKEEFVNVLNDFQVVLSREKTLGKNENFNQKYAELKKHLENNGKVKFIFFTLANANVEITDSIAAFNKNYSPNISLEVIDIERLRKDYIEFKYKEIITGNPLEYNYIAEDSVIKLDIERFANTQRDIFEFEGRAKAVSFLLKPKTIHTLFKKYKFSLFFKNVRNPIHRSNYNQKIIDTLLKKPDSFWYFNNGITAITKILPDVGVHAQKITIEGVQVINGAQTIYSVYYAYENATYMQRKAMDVYAKIAVRLIGSSDEEFNLQITRYTNMQNPLHDRDFWANDDIQQKLQNESFATNIWYEKRRDEFRLSEEEQEKLGISIIPNENFIAEYVSFHLQNPFYAIARRNDFFISSKDNTNGLYEDIFNSNKIKFEDVYASVLVWNTLMKISKLKQPLDILGAGLLATTTAISKIVMQKYFALIKPNENGKNMNISRHIIKIYKTNHEKDRIEFGQLLRYAEILVEEKLEKNNMDTFAIFEEQAIKMITSQAFYDTFAEQVQKSELDIAAIQAIELK
jgi:hypothetical protein